VIRWAWADVIASDPALSRGEWAGVRPSWTAERKVVEGSRRSVCYTFAIRACGYVLRLVIADDQPKLSLLRRVNLATALKEAVKRNAPDVEQPLSTSILATAGALVPEALPELLRVARIRRCENCTCAFRAGGPVEPDSLQGRFIAGQLAESEFVKRTAV